MVVRRRRQDYQIHVPRHELRKCRMVVRAGWTPYRALYGAGVCGTRERLGTCGNRRGKGVLMSDGLRFGMTRRQVHPARHRRQHRPRRLHQEPLLAIVRIRNNTTAQLDAERGVRPSKFEARSTTTPPQADACCPVSFRKSETNPREPNLNAPNRHSGTPALNCVLWDQSLNLVSKS